MGNLLRNMKNVLPIFKERLNGITLTAHALVVICNQVALHYLP